MRALAANLAEVADLVRPGRCVHCGVPGPVLCVACLGPADPFEVELPADLGPTGSIWAVGRYENGLRAAVLAYKERGRRDVGRAVARLLTISVTAAAAGVVGPVRPVGAVGPVGPAGVVGPVGPAGAGSVVLVPVPSTRAAARARGGQHVLRLARSVATDLGLLVAPDALRLTRSTRDSAGLGVDERRANLVGAFRAAHPPAGSGRLIALAVDDVVTTGATLAEGIRALTAAGWLVGGAAVIAATPRLFPRVDPEDFVSSPSGRLPSGLASYGP